MSPIPKDFAQRTDETPTAWLERLLVTGVEQDLTNQQRIELARYIRGARHAAGGIPPTPAVRPPEATADSLLDVHQAEAGGPYFLRLKGAEMASLGPYESSDSAYQDAGKVRAFLTEAIRQARADGAAS